MCLIDFLTDEKQKSLINMVQNRDETFDQELDSYMKLFLVELEYYVGRKQNVFAECENQNKKNADDDVDSSEESKEFDRRAFCKDDDCYLAEACSGIYTVICNINFADIRYFFEGIRYCYERWIDAQSAIALEAFDVLLKDYGLISEEPDPEKDELILRNITERVLFRGRLTDQFLGKREMFHVPYNKRYALENNRFSLTGQPILYLGNSVADIAEELEIDEHNENDMRQLKVSFFEFKDDKGNEGERRNQKIFDLRSNIWKDLKKVKNCSFSKKKFYRNILAAICSFQKRDELKQYAFKEEYVVPQMLAQVLKQNHYDGICFYSTKRFCKYHLEKINKKGIEIEQNMRYRENIAMFTKMDADSKKEASVYDKALLKSLEISMPIGIRNIKGATEEKLFSIYKSIKENCKFDQKGKNENQVSEKEEGYKSEHYFDEESLKKANFIMNYYEVVFARMEYDGKRYIDTKFGQIHLQLLIGILNRILAESEILKKQIGIKPENVDGEVTSKVPCCDLFGNDTEEKDLKEIYDNGLLHKTQIFFVIRREPEQARLQVAMPNMKHETLLYGRPDQMKQLSCELGITEKQEAKKIGTFIHRNISTEKCHTLTEQVFSLKKSFEYVEIFLCELANDQDKIEKVKWKSIDDIKTELMMEYQYFSEIYQRALPVLLNYLHNKEIESYHK